MRTLLSTVLVGLTLAAAPAMAQQHPWLPSGTPAGQRATSSGSAPASSSAGESSSETTDVLAARCHCLPNGDVPVVQHPWLPSAYAGSLPNGDTARAEIRGTVHHVRDATPRYHHGHQDR